MPFHPLPPHGPIPPAIGHYPALFGMDPPQAPHITIGAMPPDIPSASASAPVLDAHADLLRAAAQAGSQAPVLFLGLLLALLAITATLWRVLRRLRHPHASEGNAPRTLVLALRMGTGFALIVACAALFAELAEALGDEDAGRALGRVDEAFSAGTIGHVPDWLLHTLLRLTWIADRPTQTALCLLGTVALLLLRRRALALGWLLGIAGNGLLTHTLKQLFERARPEHPTEWLTAQGYSFPSGHSSGSVVIFGLLAYLATRLLPARWHLPALLAAVTLAFSVGASRVLLRVHFPSDVLAGFASGLAWLAVCVVSLELVRWYHGRGDAVEPVDR